MLASLCYRALRTSGLLALARRLRSDGVILCYHNVVGDRDVSLGNGLGLHMRRTDFERQVRWLAGRYELVSLDDFVARRARGTSLRGVAALTFDDGYAGVFDWAWPILQTVRAPATVFVVAHAPAAREAFWWDHPCIGAAGAPRDEWLTTLRGDRAAILTAVGCGDGTEQVPPAIRPADWSTIAAAARLGMGIGVHSATHRALPTLSDLELRAELVQSRDIIARHVGVTPQFFAYPYGRWDDRVRAAVRGAGYRAAFTLDHRSTRATDAWALGRVNIPSGIADAAFQAWTAGLQLKRSA